jgi:DNA polymerase III subunit gamma/tau
MPVKACFTGGFEVEFSYVLSMSESYRALTRKYRPKSFDDVVSQEHIINTLRNAIEQNRISHAYLFCGPRGVGKTTMARVVARMINGVGMDVDGEALGRTLDIIEIDAASNSGVDDVRSLREGVRVPPQSGKYKVYIIDEVHMLSKQAFNALLKTLEEPPEHVKFIFATTEPHKVLATVLSRVQRFDFRRIKVSEMVDRLRFICNEEKINIDDESLHLIGRKADGALRDALSILDQVIAFCGDDVKFEAVLNALNAISNDKLFELIDCSVSRDASRGMHIVHDLLLKGHDIQEFLVSITEHIRNMYFSRFATTEGTLLEVTNEEKKRLLEASKQFTEQDLLRMMHLTSETQVKIRDSQQPRVLLEITILKLIMMDRAEGLNELLAELRELKKKTSLTGLGVESGTTSSDSDGLATDNPNQRSPASSAGQQKNTKPVIPTQESAEITSDDIVPSNSTSNSRETTENQQKNPDSVSKSAEKSTSEQNPVVKDALFGNPAIKKGAIKNSNKEASAGLPTPDAVSDPSENFNSTGSSNGNDSSKSGEISNGNSSPNASADSHENPSEENKNVISRELIESRYDQWISEVRKVCPQFIAISLIKTRLIETGEDFVVIECQDKLIEQLFEEHNENLTACMAKVIERNVTIKTKVIVTQSSKSSNDPFASLKELQEMNPVVKTIVDVLGAELEY